MGWQGGAVRQGAQRRGRQRAFSRRAGVGSTAGGEARLEGGTHSAGVIFFNNGGINSALRGRLPGFNRLSWYHNPLFHLKNGIHFFHRAGCGGLPGQLAVPVCACFKSLRQPRKCKQEKDYRPGSQSPQKLKLYFRDSCSVKLTPRPVSHSLKGLSESVL